MTYAAAYKALNKAVKIDEILSSYSVENNLIVKKHIIDAIRYYSEFTGSDTFKRMRYWQDTSFLKTPDDFLRHSIFNAIIKFLARYEINDNELKTAELEYLIASQR